MDTTVDIYERLSGAVHYIASNNDCGIWEYNMENFQLCKHFSFPWPVNHTSLSPDGKLIIIVGDNPDGMVFDSQTGQPVASLSGHLDFSFASAWHPDGHTFATGNQDKTCRVWDVRNLSKAVVVLKGNPGAIRSVRFTSDAQFMAMTEPADFVHVHDAKNGYEREQPVASLSGHLDFSFASAWHPDGHTFATGNQDKTCRVWDVCNLSKAVVVLKGNPGAIRSVRFTSDAQFMAMTEPADFVHVHDVKNGYEREQEIDFFGEISGVSFSPDTASLFIGVWDRSYGNLLQCCLGGAVGIRTT